jgi:hypothetical protein
MATDSTFSDALNLGDFILLSTLHVACFRSLDLLEMLLTSYTFKVSYNIIWIPRNLFKKIAVCRNM